MTRLKPGDICPLCGEPIKTEDPFTLGYLSAIHDLKPAGWVSSGPCPEIPEGLDAVGGNIVSATEGALYRRYLDTGYDDLMSFDEYKQKFLENGGRIMRK